MENKGNLWSNHNASTGAAMVGEKARLQTKATLISEEIKPVAIATIELHLSEDISQSVRHSVSEVSQSVSQQKILSSLLMPL